MRAILTIAMLLSISSAHAQNIAARHTPDAPLPPQPKARPTDIPRFSKDTLTPWVNGNIPPARWMMKPPSDWSTGAPRAYRPGTLSLTPNCPIGKTRAGDTVVYCE